MPTYNAACTQDTYTYQGSPASNYSSSTVVMLGQETQSAMYYAYMLFNLPSIPGGENITGATLNLTQQSNNSNVTTVRLMSCANWIPEAQITWNNSPGGYGHAVDAYGTGAGNKSFDVSAMVKAWYGQNGSIANNGLMIFPAPPTSPGAYTAAYYSTNNGPNAPYITITTAVNTPPNAPTITSPTAGQYLNTRTPSVSWSYSDPNGDAQKAFLIQTVNDAYSAVIWSSGWITGAQTSYTVPAGAYTTDGNVYVRVQVQDAWGAVNAANGNGPDASFGNQRFWIDTVQPTIGSVTPDQIYSVAVNGSVRMWAYNVTDATTGIRNMQFPTWSDVGGQDDIVWHDAIRNGSTNDFYCDIPIGSPAARGSVEGHYTVHMYAWDNAGNSTSTPTGFTIDRTAPTIGSVSGQQYIGGNSATVQAFNVTDNLGVSYVSVYAVRPDGSYYLLGNATASGSTYSYNVTDITIDGNWHYDFRAYDQAGNVSPVLSAYVFRDTVKAADPNPQQSHLTTTATISWSAFSDPSPSSGYLNTRIYMDKWNGSAWVAEPNNGTVITTNSATLSTALTGLTQGALYRCTICHFDIAGNQSNFTYIQFTTKKQIGTYKPSPNAALTVPIFDVASGVISKTLRIQTAAGLGCFELVPINDPNASAWRVQTAAGLKAVSKQ